METKHGKDNILRFPDGKRPVASFMMHPNGKLVTEPRHHPVVVFLARIAFMLAVAFLTLLTGCVGQVTTTQAGGAMELSFVESSVPGGAGWRWYTVATDGLAREAVERCPAGYTKLNERVVPGEQNQVIWHIRCLP